MNPQPFYQSYLSLIKEPNIDIKGVSDCLIGWYCDFFGELALKNKHSELTGELGRFHPEDSLYEDRTAYILNLILFSEPSSQDLPASPYEIFCRELLRTMKPETPITNLFFQPCHSVFAVKRSKKNAVRLLDLFNKQVINLSLQDNKQEHLAFSEKALIQTILFNFHGHYLFSSGYIFHDQGALKTIQKYIASQRLQDEHGESLVKDKASVLKRLAATQLNHYRLSHVPAEKIYIQRLALPI